MTYTLHQGDCLEILRTLPDASVDAVVCDPPYGLSFMGKRWDYDVPAVEVWAECLRVLKPGGHLLAFAGTRTQHRMAVRIEDAGFEIRDLIAWVYSQGFPKSLDVSKAIDAQAGAEREVLRQYRAAVQTGATGGLNGSKADKNGVTWATITAPATEAAKQWQGWGTALKPALEPITVARKPLDGTVAENVLAHGTGALNVDGCRVGTDGPSPSVQRRFAGAPEMARSMYRSETHNHDGLRYEEQRPGEMLGRWPANLIHDGSEEVVGLFPGNEDGGSAARFFYCAKASKADRDAGCEGMEQAEAMRYGEQGQGPEKQQTPRKPTLQRNHHPTVKPTDLMRYLCRLVTPPGGVVLDPFTGSGSTGRGAILEGFRFVGIEREPEYVAIARARIEDAVGTRRAQTAQGELGL